MLVVYWTNFTTTRYSTISPFLGSSWHRSGRHISDDYALSCRLPTQYSSSSHCWTAGILPLEARIISSTRSLRCIKNSATAIHSSAVMPSTWMTVRQISRISSLETALIRCDQSLNSLLDVMCCRRIPDTKGLSTMLRNRCTAAPACTPRSAWLWSKTVTGIFGSPRT